jgi:serine/threonine protein kinase
MWNHAMNTPSLVEDVFLAALEKATPAERAAYLDEACAGDPELRRRVERLLHAHPRAGEFLEKPAVELAGTGSAQGEPGRVGAGGSSGAGAAPPAEIGTCIGPYKLLQQLGEGGMGTVYVAEQEHPVKRRVALKVIKPGMDSAQVIRRFEAERQALALMDHTNIAKVFEAGTTSGEPGGVSPGRPYFVMELVKGEPITKYCDSVHLPIRERLALFEQVCAAIQHAHQKGIIHRDIKPSNVLVCMQDGKPVPKVIDFGVAKALYQKLTDRTMYTEIGQIVGTLEYMSPEQAELSAMDIDTRADVYALGVLLYELLAGSTPLDRTRLRSAAYTEMLRIIKEEEPPRPSTRLTESKDSLPNLAAQRRAEPASLPRMLKGELDWVVMKALEKDRTRRYETASGLARDIQHYLADEVVEARPPSRGYRLRKFTRKHRAALATAALIGLLLLLGIAVSTWQAVRARRAEQAAMMAAAEERQARESEAEQRRRAEANEQKAGAAAAAERKARETAQAREAESKAVLAEARLRMTLGSSFWYLGEFKAAAEQYEAARALYARCSGPEHPDTLRSMNYLADSYASLGRNADAVKLYEQTLALRKAKLGADHPDTLSSMNNLANAYAGLGRHAEALKLREEALALYKARLGPNDPGTMSSMNNLANSYFSLSRLPEAVKLYEETLALRKAKLGADHPDTLSSMNNLGTCYAALGRQAEALKLREETLAIQKARLGPEHPDTLGSMDNLAQSYAALGRHAEARKLREETLALMKAKLGPNHPNTLKIMKQLASPPPAPPQEKKLEQAANAPASEDAFDQAEKRLTEGKPAEAIKLFEQAYKARAEKLGKDHPQTTAALYGLGRAYLAYGEGNQAIKYLEEALVTMRGAFPQRPEETAVRQSLASAYRSIGKAAQAVRLFEEVCQEHKTKLGPDHPTTLIALGELAVAYRDVGRFNEAAAVFTDAIKGMTAKLGPDHLATLQTQSKLAELHLASKKYAEAEAVARPACERWQKRIESMSQLARIEREANELAALQSLLGACLFKQEKFAEAERLLLGSHEVHKQRAQKTSGRLEKLALVKDQERLVELYDAWGKKDKADEWRKRLAEAKALPQP